MTIQLNHALASIRIQTRFKPDIALVLGSGLGELAGAIDGVSIPYSDISNFPVSTAPNHAGRLHLGTLFGKKVVAMQGRVHRYEGYSAQEVVLPIRVMGMLGANQIIITNAAGGINSAFNVGNIVAVEDHFALANLAGGDPLRGPNIDALGDRFVSLNKAYSPELIDKAKKAAALTGQKMDTGVYGYVTGPSFESPAEIRFLRQAGCDLVGMSTVPEVIAARHMGLEVLVLSAVTNMAVTDITDSHITNVEEVWDAAELIRPKMRDLLKLIIGDL